MGLSRSPAAAGNISNETYYIINKAINNFREYGSYQNYQNVLRFISKQETQGRNVDTLKKN